jgi:hypothetical protein
MMDINRYTDECILAPVRKLGPEILLAYPEANLLMEHLRHFGTNINTIVDFEVDLVIEH